MENKIEMIIIKIRFGTIIWNKYWMESNTYEYILYKNNKVGKQSISNYMNVNSGSKPWMKWIFCGNFLRTRILCIKILWYILRHCTTKFEQRTNGEYEMKSDIIWIEKSHWVSWYGDFSSLFFISLEDTFAIKWK